MADELVPTKQPEESQIKPINHEVSEQGRIVKPSVVLYEWEAPERMFKTYSREFYRKIAIILLFFAIIFVIIKEFIVVALLGVIFFAVYVFHTIPPRRVRHQITTNGINYASGHLYKWEELKNFYIEPKEEYTTLNVNTIEILPGRIFMIVDKSIDPMALQTSMNEYISILENPEPNEFEKVISFFKKWLKV